MEGYLYIYDLCIEQPCICAFAHGVWGYTRLVQQYFVKNFMSTDRQ